MNIIYIFSKQNRWGSAINLPYKRKILLNENKTEFLAIKQRRCAVTWTVDVKQMSISLKEKFIKNRISLFISRMCSDSERIQRVPFDRLVSLLPSIDSFQYFFPSFSFPSWYYFANISSKNRKHFSGIKMI